MKPAPDPNDLLSHTLKMRAVTMLFPTGILLLKGLYYGVNGFGSGGAGLPAGGAVFLPIALMWLAAIGLVENRRRQLRGHTFLPVPLVEKSGKVAAVLVAASLIFGFWVPPAMPFVWVPGLLAGMFFWQSMGRLVEALEPADRPGDFEKRRIAELTERARAYIAETLAAARRFRDPALEARLGRLGDKTLALLGSLEAGIGNVSLARKYITAYLQSTRDATVMFGNFYARNRDADSKLKYEALLDDLEAFVEKRDGKILEAERALLDIEFETLRERMKVELE